MKVLVTVDGRETALEVLRNSERVHFRFRPANAPDSLERTASVIEAEPGIYSVLIEGRSYEVKIVPGPATGYLVDVAGRHMAVEVRDPRAVSASHRAGAGEGRQNVSAPMPGKVVRLLVAAGDEVEAGQGVVVVEAMTMQNEMKSPRRGRVVELRVQEGATVTAGEVLAVIE